MVKHKMKATVCKVKAKLEIIQFLIDVRHLLSWVILKIIIQML